VPEDVRRLIALGCFALCLIVSCELAATPVDRKQAARPTSSSPPARERARPTPLLQETCRIETTRYSEVGDGFLFAPPNPAVLPVCRSVAEGVARRADGAPDSAVTFSALMTRAAAEPILGITNRNRDRLLWIVTVHWPAWTNGSPWSEPMLKAAYTIDVDAETGLPAGDICFGCAALSTSS
jgi:hypothetical protein